MIRTFSDLKTLMEKNALALAADSRKVQENTVFVFMPLAQSSHKGIAYPSVGFIADAIKNGAKYIVLTEENYTAYQKEFSADDAISFIFVENTRSALGELAQIAFDTKNYPIPVIALIGTNGKTTSSYLLEHLYKSCGKNPAVLGTVSYHWQGHFEDAPLTTPDCLTLHKALADIKKAHCDVVIMEVSSHALDQNRVAGIEFSGAIFTNLTQDHLDYHENMENYFQAKAKMFVEMPKKNKAMSIFGNDKYGQRLIELCPTAIPFYLHQKGCADSSCIETDNPILHGQLKANSPKGLVIEHCFNGEKWDVSTHLVGEHNACNILGVECLALQMGFSIADMQKLSTFAGVPGRLERIYDEKKNVSYFVDYAHTPDALVHAQDALRQAGFKRILTLFGCGGDRDKTKRPLMGKAVAEASDIVILTSDNPRTEDPEQILDDIMPGLAAAKEVHRIANRKEALQYAVQIAKDGDAVLVAGKGHEPYQIIGKTKYHFSDQEIIKEEICK